jgi:hypothetical protein
MRKIKTEDLKTAFWVLAVVGVGARIAKALLAPRQGCVSRSGTKHLGWTLDVEGCYEDGKLRYRWLVVHPQNLMDSYRGTESYDSQAEASLRGRAQIEQAIRDFGDDDSFSKEDA